MRVAKERLQRARKVFQFFFLKKDTKEKGLWWNELERKNKKQKGNCEDKDHQL